MARNEEKNLARLNRLLLQNQKEENLKKNPPRPKLETLTTADDIKKWLPSIKRDIDFNLKGSLTYVGRSLYIITKEDSLELFHKQSQVPCYPDRKIKEFTDRIDHLQRLYKSFVRKLKEVDPHIGSIPWIDRGYESRKRHAHQGDSQQDSLDSDVIETKKAKENFFSEKVKDAFLSETEENMSETEENDSDQVDCDCEKDIVTDIVKSNTFVPIKTPILDSEKEFGTSSWTRCHEQRHIDLNVNLELQDQPLSFDRKFHGNPNLTKFERHATQDEVTDKSETNNSLLQHICNSVVHENLSDNRNFQNSSHVLTLNLPYSDSEDSDS